MISRETRQQAQRPAAEVGWSALCARCPSPEEVAALLEREGFRLSFHLPVSRDRWGFLPAQDHYTDATGTEVVWLAGPDPELREPGRAAPAHRSRFWVYASRRDPAQARARQIRARLREAFALDWQPLAASLANPLRPTS